VEEDALHVFVVVRVAVRMTVVSVITILINARSRQGMIMSNLLIMPVAMVSVTKSCKTHYVHHEAESADDQKLVEPMKFVSFP
jgi:uncharacterized membrane protein